MIQTNFRVFDRRRGFQSTCKMCPVARGVTANQQPDHIAKVFLRSGQPVLQGHKIGADVLGGSGNETQQLRKLPQHFHLAAGI